MFNAILLVCAQALFVQSISGQCLGAGYGPFAAEASLAAANWAGMSTGLLAADASLAAANCAGIAAAGPWAAGPFNAPWSAAGPASVSASHGGAMPTASASPIPPSGVSVRSDNAIEGPLAVSGALPFLGTVALEGLLPTAGAGAVAYGCGNGEVAMLSEDMGAAGYNGLSGPLGYGAGALGYAAGPLGYNAGLMAPAARAGCGCGSRLF